MSENYESNKHKEASIIKLKEIFDALQAYNNEHNIGVDLALLIRRQINSVDVEKSEAQLEENRRKALLKIMEANKLATSLGLELVYGTEEGIKMVVQNYVNQKAETSSPLKISIVVSDSKKFIDFLSGIDKTDFDKHPDIKKDIIEIVLDLTQQVENTQSTDKVAASPLANGDDILDQFKRLGLGSRTERLAEDLMNAEMGTMEELKLLRNSQCFDSPGGKNFGPSQWQKDMGPKDYENRWKKTEDAVQQALRNKNAAPLVQKAIENLVACADYAIKEMETVVASDDTSASALSYKKSYPTFLKICQKYKGDYEDLLARKEEDFKFSVN